ncbi:uncharacterized protein ACJ7VT_020601 [Polymixia lowei]
MKLAAVFAFVSVSVMLGMIYQAAKQELNLRSLKTHMMQSSVEVKRKEDAIIEMKAKIQDLNKSLLPLNTKRDELEKKKKDTVKSTEDMNNNLQTCNTEKGEADKKKAGFTEDLTKVKAEHEEAKKKAQEEIQHLKQQILDRDAAICAFVDKANEEGRKMCGITEASN